MLKIENLIKVYPEKTPVVALNRISLEFPNSGFVSIIGPTGCGKTTLLNIIGGLDNYDEGDLIINGVHTKDFKSADWDAYRSKHIGFVFQTGNLIKHLSIRENIALPQKLNGSHSHARVNELISQFGLEKHLDKPVTRLSGGEKQLVGIARALVNNPEIILADEVTASLDPVSAAEVMKKLQEISQNRLVIMITHNETLAKTYSDRLIQIEKGMVKSDKLLRPEIAQKKVIESKPTRAHTMGIMPTVRFAMGNLFSKKFRTIVETIAVSMGILALSLILALSNGFDKYIDGARRENVNVPIVITGTTESGIVSPLFQGEITNKEGTAHLKADWYSAVSFNRALDFNLLVHDESPMLNNIFCNGIHSVSGKKLNFQEIIDVEMLKEHYDAITGTFPETHNQIAIVANDDGSVDMNLLECFGVTFEVTETLDDLYAKILKDNTNQPREFRWVPNDKHYYFNSTLNRFQVAKYDDYGDSIKIIYDDLEPNHITVSGIIKPKSSTSIRVLNPGYVYNNTLTKYIVDGPDDVQFSGSKYSQIVTRQLENHERNVFTGLTQTKEQREAFLAKIGANYGSTQIKIFPRDLNGAEEIRAFIDDFNKRAGVEPVEYLDSLAETIRAVNGISTVLLASAFGTIVVSALLLALITYIGVMERMREIAIMRSLGARKRSISAMIILETVTIGICAGLIGSLLGVLMLVPFNAVIGSIIGVSGISKIAVWHPIALVISAAIVTMVAGLVPAIRAAKTDPAKVLRQDF